ncbi:MAG: hypothetical protein HYZ00_05840 [Candidatus Hydrogenedentes bacterium]|nr:hypothetical protein [Candidatus Hydrogenedentota bacterium]
MRCTVFPMLVFCGALCILAPWAFHLLSVQMMTSLVQPGQSFNLHNTTPGPMYTVATYVAGGIMVLAGIAGGISGTARQPDGV